MSGRRPKLASSLAGGATVARGAPDAGCGMADTTPKPSYVAHGVWTVRDVRARVLQICLLCALVLHAPLLPVRLLGFVRLLLRAQTEETGPDDSETVIPVELDTDLSPPGSPAPAPASTLAPPPTAQLDEIPDNPSISVDAGVPPPAVTDAGAQDAGPEEDAGLDASAPLDAGAEQPAPDAGTVADPFAVAGGPGGVTPKHPNVRVLIAADLVRKHPVGAMFSEMLALIPEWTELVGGTGIDPIRDFNHVLVSGPQFRNPTHIVAVLDYTVSTAKMRQALNAIMARSKPPGQWLDGFKIPVASLGNKGYRRAALLADKKLLVLMPADAEEQIDGLAAIKPFKPSTDQSIVLFLVTPWRAFRGTGFEVPKRIAWMRLAMVAVDTPKGPGAGGYTLTIEAEDESPEAAAEDARKLAAGIEEIRTVDLGVWRTEVIGKPTFSSDGNKIRATAAVSVEQVERIIKLIKGWMKERVKDEAKKPVLKKERQRRHRKALPTAPTATAAP